EITVGNIMALQELPEGCPIFNIERIPGDGGSLVRASGLYGLVMSKEKNRVFVKLPSGKIIALNPAARATIGCSAGGGRKEKPMVKAGTAHMLAKARGRAYPVVRGVAMNPPSHPFGGSQHHPGKSKSTARSAPPGRKVGAIASKRTGRRKKN
ncbi:MAG: 50S ribosomal protein L2, partial [archaeon]